MPTYKDINFSDIHFTSNHIQYRSHVIEYDYVHSISVRGRVLTMNCSKKTNQPSFSIHFGTESDAKNAMDGLRKLLYHGESQNHVIRRTVAILG